MLRLLITECITAELAFKIKDKLSAKTNMFSFKDEGQFVVDLISGSHMVWTNDEGLYVLGQLREYDTSALGLSLTVVNLTDVKHDLQMHLMEIEESAKEHGVTHIILDGRTGWKKVFPDYKVTSVILTKEL